MKKHKKTLAATVSSFAKRQLPSLLTEKDLGHIIVKKDSFVAELKGDRREVVFDKICKVTAFKADMLTVDLICLEIVSEEGAVCLVNEDMDNFGGLCKVLNKILPTIHEDWYEAVVAPAFKPNKLTIWKK